jgi:hypothetical protein
MQGLGLSAHAPLAWILDVHLLPLRWHGLDRSEPGAAVVTDHRVEALRAPTGIAGRNYSGCEYELYVLTQDWLYVAGGTVIYRNLKKVTQAANDWNGSGMRVFIVTKVAP